MKLRIGWYLVAIALVLAGVYFIETGEDLIVRMAALGALALVFGPLTIPAVRRTIRRHELACRVASVGVSLAGFAFLAVSVSRSSELDPNLGSQVFAAALLAGVFLFRLPQMSRSLDRDLGALRAIPIERVAPSRIHALTEVRQTLVELINHRADVLREVGPWFSAFLAVPLVIANFGSWKASLAPHQQLSALLSLGLMGFVFAEALIVVMAAIQWSRFMANHRVRGFLAIPWRRLRWWLFTCLILGSFAVSLELWLRAHLPGAPVWERLGLEQAGILIILVLASPWALAIPAAAVNHDGGVAAQMRALHPVRRQYYLGAATLLAPYLAIVWGLNLAYAGSRVPIVRGSCLVAEWVLLFAMVIVGTTYVTRMYLMGSAAPGWRPPDARRLGGDPLRRSQGP
jgi:hypothetical protein